jgi:O-methyltransferase
MSTLSELVRSRLPRRGRGTGGPVSPETLRRTHPDIEPGFLEAWQQCAPYTMTSVERMYGLWHGVRHVCRRAVAGDVVECGVWRGGSSMLSALALRQERDEGRTVWLYDTFEGMTEPGERDADPSGTRMVDVWDHHRGRTGDPVFAFGALEDVQANMARTGTDLSRVRYVKGPVEETIPGEVPERIALLRLDTDWYESTRHELEHLWDRLSPNGVLIIDDYGHWAGAREAVDEFFAGRDDAPLLNRLDYTGRIAVKVAMG